MAQSGNTVCHFDYISNTYLVMLNSPFLGIFFLPLRCTQQTQKKQLSTVTPMMTAINSTHPATAPAMMGTLNRENTEMYTQKKQLRTLTPMMTAIKRTHPATAPAMIWGH